jgi:hypothetical protein
MSIGNLKTEGNKGNNFPYQLRSLQLLAAINDSINTLPGVDYETRTTTYEATADGIGYSQGDIVVRYDIINVATSTLVTEMWFNQTLQTTITPAPLAANLVPINAPSGVTVLNGPLTAAVNIQDGGNVISVDDAGSSLTVDDGGVALATYPFPAQQVSGYNANISTTSPVDIIAAVPAKTIYITQILVTNAHATVGTAVYVRDDLGTKVYVGYAAPAGGGFSASFPTPLKMPAVGQKVQAVCVTSGADVYVSINGFAV